MIICVLKLCWTGADLPTKSVLLWRTILLTDDSELNNNNLKKKLLVLSFPGITDPFCF